MVLVKKDKTYMLGLLKDQIKYLSDDELILSLKEDIGYYAQKYVNDAHKANRLLLIANELKLRLLMGKRFLKNLVLNAAGTIQLILQQRIRNKSRTCS